MELAKVEGNPYEIRKFYQFFDQIKTLRMWKMQLLDEDHVLIRYASEDVVTLRSAEPNAQPSFFVVYNMSTTQVRTVLLVSEVDLFLVRSVTGQLVGQSLDIKYSFFSQSPDFTLKTIYCPNFF